MTLIAILIILDIVLIGVIVYFYMIERKGGDRSEIDPFRKKIQDIPESISRLVGETREFLDKLSEDIERKKGTLDELLTKVDEQNLRLERNIKEASGLINIIKGLGSHEDALPTLSHDSKAEEACEADEGRAQDRMSEVASEISPESIYEEVMKLADEGRSIREIANRLRISRGEVELILGLKSRRDRM